MSRPIIVKDGEVLLEMNDINGQMTLVVTSTAEISGGLSPRHNLLHEEMRTMGKAVLRGEIPATAFLEEIFDNDPYMMDFLSENKVMRIENGILFMAIAVNGH
jgi:hypothetical protein